MGERVSFEFAFEYFATQERILEKSVYVQGYKGGSEKRRGGRGTRGRGEGKLEFTGGTTYYSIHQTTEYNNPPHELVH